MSRTRKDRIHKQNRYYIYDSYSPGWGAPGVGKFWKRQYWKSVRSLHRGTGGKERSVLHYGSECEWKCM